MHVTILEKVISVDKNELYSRLKNDVIAHYYKDVHLQNNRNILKKTLWEEDINEGRVIKRTEDYRCSYSFIFDRKDTIPEKNFLLPHLEKLPEAIY